MIIRVYENTYSHILLIDFLFKFSHMPNWIEKFSSWYFSKSALPFWCILLLDLAAIVFAGLAAVYFCVGGNILAHHFWQVVMMWIYVLPFYLIGMYLFHTFSGIIRYSSFTDLMRIMLAVSVGAVLTAVCYKLIPFGIHTEMPILRVVCISYALSVIFVGGIRIAVKYMYDTAVVNTSTQRVFIYGVQNGGLALAKSMRNENPRRYQLTGFMSDEKDTVGKLILNANGFILTKNR